MKIRDIITQTAHKLNLCPNPAQLNGTDTQILLGLLRDVLNQFSTSNAFNNRVVLKNAPGKGKNYLTIGLPLDENGRPVDMEKMQKEGTWETFWNEWLENHPGEEPDVVCPRPFNIQSVYASAGGGWMKLRETSLASLPAVSYNGSTNLPTVFAYEQSWPYGTIHFNRGFDGNARICFSKPFPEFDVNADLEIPPEYQRAVFWSLVLEASCMYGLAEQQDEAKAMRDEAIGLVEQNNEKSDPVDFDDEFSEIDGSYRSLDIMNLI